MCVFFTLIAYSAGDVTFIAIWKMTSTTPKYSSLHSGVISNFKKSFPRLPVTKVLTESLRRDIRAPSEEKAGTNQPRNQG